MRSLRGIPVALHATLLAGAAAVALSFTATPLPAADPAELSLLVEDFESATLGARPYFWREVIGAGTDAVVGAERAPRPGAPTNKALEIAYEFPAAFQAAHAVEVGPRGQALPGALRALAVHLHGDGSGHAFGVRLRDRDGELYEWRVPVSFSGWQRVDLPLDARTARRSGPAGNGSVDHPLALYSIRVSREAAGPRKGVVLVDDLTAISRAGEVRVLLDSALAVTPAEWRVVLHRAQRGAVTAGLAPLAGREQPALRLVYELGAAADASVEFQRPLPLGPGHGTLLLDLFGDGSNTVLRFRVSDAAGAVWSATWAQVLIDWSGWKQVYLDTRTLRQPAGADPSAEPSRFPLSFQGLVIDDASPADMLPGVESGRQGELYLGRVAFAPEP